MKKSDFQQLKTKSKNELVKKLFEEKKGLTNLLMEQSMGKLKNLHKVGALKRDIAKISTIIKLKEFEQKEDLQKAKIKEDK